jgi:hypothetical protein
MLVKDRREVFVFVLSPVKLEEAPGFSRGVSSHILSETSMFSRLLGASALVALCLAPSLAFAQQVTPRGGAVTVVTTGGTAVTAISGPSNGCYIINPLTTTDEGLGLTEPLYVDPTTAATTAGNVTNVALAPGQPWFCPANSTLPVSVNAASSGHKFTVVRW